MLAATVKILLDNFVACSDDIQGVAIVSPQGQPLIHPFGFSEESTHMLAGSMLYLVSCLSEHCQWHSIDWVTVRMQEGYFICSQFDVDAFLLLQTTIVPTEYLQNHILQHLEKLQTIFKSSDEDTIVLQESYHPIELPNGLGVSSITNGNDVSSQNFSAHPQQGTPSFPIRLDVCEIAYCQKELTEEIGPIASTICDQTIQQNPDLSLMELINILSKYIPDQLAALEFQKRLGA